jgi:hypothetical protein
MFETNWWRDPASAWWAKVDRAKHHINALASDIDSFLESTAYEVFAEPGEQPNETIYQLRMHFPIPVHFSTTIGDALHNLRSALDCAAYEMARRHVGRDLTEKEELVCEFPIRDDPHKLAQWSCPSAGVNDDGRRSLQELATREGTHARVQASITHRAVACRGRGAVRLQP